MNGELHPSWIYENNFFRSKDLVSKSKNSTSQVDSYNPISTVMHRIYSGIDMRVWLQGYRHKSIVVRV
jgi:hypothetical protein